jgi:predicted heme/steroid binding protein
MFYGGKYIREAVDHINKKLGGEDEYMPVEYNAKNGEFYIEFMGQRHKVSGIPVVRDIEKKPVSYVEVDHIIYNAPATIVFWKDGTKTVVKCMEGTPFNPYYGFVCALAKKVYGSNSLISRIVDEYTEV